MLITFAAGLWNIGVEGQMLAGALMTTWVVQSIEAPAGRLLLPLTIVAGLLGGALWGVLIGLLRTYGHVNEIFAGLGLNFVGSALTNYLIFGPWKPPGGATMSGTEPFPLVAWMPTIGSSRASWLALLLALSAIVLVFVILRDTRWGLVLKAIGLNPTAARRMGVNTNRQSDPGARSVRSAGRAGRVDADDGDLSSSDPSDHRRQRLSGTAWWSCSPACRAQWVPLVVFFFCRRAGGQSATGTQDAAGLVPGWRAAGHHGAVLSARERVSPAHRRAGDR